jgi:BirA family biotin operon repressor/biotin-[acetyl-CoA-carboxylase] ligase
MKKEDFPEDLRMPAASLMECAGRKVDRVKLLCALLESLDEGYEVLKIKGIMSTAQRWRRLCGTLNKRIKVSLPGGIITGIAEDVTQEGGLVIRTGDGSTKVIFAGDVTLLEE